MTARTATTKPVRVLIVDDARTSRAVLSALCAADETMTVVGEAVDGEEAVELTKRLRPDVVVMDITMPRLDGYDATRRIMTDTPTPVVLVTAANDPTAVDVALRALEAGALTVLAKPQDAFGPQGSRDADLFRTRVKRLSEVGVIRRFPTRSAPMRQAPGATSEGGPPDAVAVVASTGGPQALVRFLTPFPSDFGAPILVVQHIVAGFIAGLALWLDDRLALNVKVAQDGEKLRGGTVYVAPDNAHLRITTGRRVALGQDPPLGGFRPSATALLSSAADVYKNRLVAVVLTGMGSDGLQGAHAVHNRGGTVMAQDEETSVVFGMPGVVVAAGIADAVDRVEQLANRIVEQSTGGAT